MNYREAPIFLKRMCSTNAKQALSSNQIRKTFLDYFIKDHGHKFVRSSPVIPYCDPTVAFVNAGMNQFKSIFLGNTKSVSPRVVNSQKCIRVGGKHNDLSIVGKDGYHHTFFEMLGNWSFGDYFKKDACDMAWNLLKGPFGIDPSRLYVTYFAGDKTMNLPPDDECREIWRSLGVPEGRILAFDSKDNFWEMGATGPCGPCTEIHIDHMPHSNPEIRAKYVNAGLPDLTELWNLVFIQYNRKEDGSVVALPKKHIDTGMGMERLTAILQGKLTNYETDLFVPIFDAIQKNTNLPPYSGVFVPNSEKFVLDTSYRVLADHSRMIIACLADGMLPDQSHKLRRIIRKSMLLASNIFKKDNLLHSVIPKVAEVLGPTYPEMKIKLSDVLTILAHEYDIFAALKQNCSADIKQLIASNKNLEELDIFDSPGFVPAYKDLLKSKATFSESTIPGNFAFKMRDTYGLDVESIEKLAAAEGLQLDMDGFKDEVRKAKEKSKEAVYIAGSTDKAHFEVGDYTAGLKNTQNFYKYNYTFNANTQLYEVPIVKTKILGIIDNGNVVESVDATTKNRLTIITEKSNFYFESGGQQSDRGKIVKTVNGQSVQFNVEGTSLSNGCVLHTGMFDDKCNYSNIQLDGTDEVELHVDSIRRTKNIMHHTATHLLNASVRHVMESVTYQSSSSVTSDYLKLELGIIGRKIDKDVLEKIESLIRRVIENNVATNVSIVSIQDVLTANDIVMVPGEIYPETGLRLLCIEDCFTGLSSKELCCGTHALSTAELKDFCLTNLKQTGRSKYAFFAAAGITAIQTRERGRQVESAILQCESSIKTDQHNLDAIETRLLKLRNQVLNSESELPYLVKLECIDKINTLIKTLKDASKTILKEFVEIEMRNVLQENPPNTSPYIVHFLKCSTMMEDVSLQKATRLCADRPILVVSFADGKVKARCVVPKDMTDRFSADEWLQQLAKIFNAQISPPKGQNPSEVCNMKPKKTQSSLFHEQLGKAINEAKRFASSKL